MGLFASCLKAPKKTNQHCCVLAGEVCLQFDSKHRSAFRTCNFAIAYAKEWHPRCAIILTAFAEIDCIFFAILQGCYCIFCAIAMTDDIFVIVKVLLISIKVSTVLVVVILTNIAPFDALFTKRKKTHAVAEFSCCHFCIVLRRKPPN